MSWPQTMAATRPDGQRLELISARELQGKTFPPINWIADGLIAEGLTVFAGKPKLGKSWMALDLAVAVAEGSQFLGQPCDQGAVLYLAKEDNQRRLRDRLEKIRPDGTWPDALSLTTECAGLDQGGLEAIEGWVMEAQSPRLIIIDTLATVRPMKVSGMTDYQADYAALRGLHHLANSTGIGIIAVHHVRKTAGDDQFDAVSGSTGLTGAADTTVILTKSAEHGGCILYGRGRDVTEYEWGVTFSDSHCRWQMVGDPDTCFLSDTRSLILDAMDAGKQTPAAIAQFANITDQNARKTLSRMLSSGQVEKDGRGCYKPKPKNPVTPVTMSQCDAARRI